jgi:hypothetical protein
MTAAGSANSTYHRFSFQCKCEECDEYCPPVFGAATPEAGMAKRQKPSRPAGVHKKSTTPLPLIKDGYGRQVPQPLKRPKGVVRLPIHEEPLHPLFE